MRKVADIVGWLEIKALKNKETVLKLGHQRISCVWLKFSNIQKTETLQVP